MLRLKYYYPIESQTGGPAIIVFFAAAAAAAACVLGTRSRHAVHPSASFFKGIPHRVVTIPSATYEHVVLDGLHFSHRTGVDACELHAREASSVRQSYFKQCDG